MLSTLKNLVRDESGQDLAEYGIALAVIAVGAAAIAVAIGTDVNTLWSNARPSRTQSRPSIKSSSTGTGGQESLTSQGLRSGGTGG
jgi:Flp pilus assembly pilin Flp